MMKLPYSKKLFSTVAFMALMLSCYSQELVQVREAELIRGGYDIEGTAFLELYDDGVLLLKLSSDYDTPSGPDVQLFLSKHPNNIGGAHFVANLSDLRAFAGAQTFTIDSSVDINEFNYIIFRCVQFGLHWAGGVFGMPTDPGDGGGTVEPMDTCLSTGVATTDWIAEVQICPNDGEDDNIALKNTVGISGGESYAYIITDDQSKIITIQRTDSYNFEGSGLGTNLVYGVSYSGELTYNVGDDWNSVQASGCIEFSDAQIFLTVKKDGCPMDCQNSLVATTDWESRVDICPTDGVADVIPLKNTINVPAGEHYAYVITDTQRRIIKVHKEDSYDFEGSGTTTHRVYGISYNGNLNYTEGNPYNTIESDECIIHSDANVYLTVTKNACVAMPECFETNVASTAWQTDFSICPLDGESDSIFLQNNLMIPPGNKYAFVLTDENRRIKKLIVNEWYDFEGSGQGEDRVYGISYDGTLSNFTPGDQLSTLTADGCATISSSDLFIKVTKDGCVASTGSISGKVTNYKGEGVSDVMIMLNTGASAMTQSDGSYSFTDLPLNTAYTLTPSKDDNFSNGVSAQDLVIMQRHVLGLQTIDNPYILIGIDANKDERISALDIINFLNLIIGRTSQIADNTPWRFVPGTKTFENGADPFDFVEKDAVQNLSGDVSDLNFTAIKTGDASGNAKVN